jgi:pimeloyl-ACP methyl ester carboxylesterase
MRQTQTIRPATRTPSLEDVLRSEAREAVPPPDVSATVSMDAGDGIGWTARIAGGEMTIEPGQLEAPTLRILSDPETLAAVIGGTRSGVEAFLKGDLRVRGNLALALRLDSMFRPKQRPKRWPTARSVRVRRLHTSYLEAGKGPPLIALHGLGATNSSLLPTIWDLARDFRVIAPDLPGFGDSAKPIRAYTAAFFSGWLTGLMDELGIERAHVLGNSMGGRVALEVGMVAPERVGTLLLLAPSPAFIRGRQFVRVVRVLRPELALVPLPVSHRQVVGGIRGLFSRPSRLPPAWYEAAADEFIRVFRTPRGRMAFFSAARQIYLEEPGGDHGFWSRLPGLTRPALFVWGDRDRLVPARFERHVVAALPNATSVVLEDSGHVPQFEHPKETHRLVREFIQERG